MYYYVSINNMSNFMLTITDSVSKSAEGPIGFFSLRIKLEVLAVKVLV